MLIRHKNTLKSLLLTVCCLCFATGMTLTPELSSSVMSVPEDLVVRRMVALFDYDPWESSPNFDSEVRAACFVFHLKANWHPINKCFFFSQEELGFRSGDIIYVLGEMDQDGFYYVSVSYINDIERVEFFACWLVNADFRVIYTGEEVWSHPTICSHCHGISSFRKKKCFSGLQSFLYIYIHM